MTDLCQQLKEKRYSIVEHLILRMVSIDVYEIHKHLQKPLLLDYQINLQHEEHYHSDVKICLNSTKQHSSKEK